MRRGIFGGSFDPVHKGHIHLATSLKKILRLDVVLVVPTCISPFKQASLPMASAEDRVAMLKIAFAKEKGVEISDLEIRRGGVSYTVDTLRLLKKKYPSDELFLLLSKDSVLTFPLWKEHEKILELAHVVFAVDSIEKYKGVSYGEMIEIFWDESLSSTAVRQRLREGAGCSSYLLPKVMDYIEEHHLYS